MNFEKGILISKIKYSETSLILTVFTKKNGSQSFLFLGGMKKLGNTLMPFSYFSFNYFGKGELKKINLIEHTTNSYSFNPIKNCVSIFLSEILKKTINNHPPDLSLFHFLESAIKIFNQCHSFNYFPVWFLISFCRFLGIYPNTSKKGNYFDYSQGEFVFFKPKHNNFSDEKSSSYLKKIIGIKFDKLRELNFNNYERNKLLKLLIEYYQFHIEGFKQVQSLEVLETVFYD